MHAELLHALRCSGVALPYWLGAAGGLLNEAPIPSGFEAGCCYC